jgi:hypothetical protein
MAEARDYSQSPMQQIRLAGLEEQQRAATSILQAEQEARQLISIQAKNLAEVVLRAAFTVLAGRAALLYRRLLVY